MNKFIFLFLIMISILFSLPAWCVNVYALDNDSLTDPQNESELSYELDNSDIQILNRNFIEIEYALKDKDYEKAIRLLKESEMIDPANENITNSLSVTLANYAVYLSSIDKFDTALENIEESYVVSPSQEVEKIYKTILNNYIVSLLDKRDWESALKNLHYLYSLDSSNNEIINKIARIYSRWGMEFLNKNEEGQAADKFLKSLEYDSFYKDALFYLGYILYNDQDLRGAKYYWLILANQDPEYMQVSDLIDKLERELEVEEDLQYKDEDCFQLHYGGNLEEDLVQDIHDILNEAYSKIGARLSYYPDRKITVLMLDRDDFSRDTNLPHWIGGLYDGKIRLPIPDAGTNWEITEDFRQTIFHEYTHVVVHGLTGNKIPLWLNEGLAEYLSGKKAKYSLLKENILNNSYIRLMNLDRFLSDTSSQTRMNLAYESSMSVVNYIVDRYGMRQIKRMLSLFAEGETQQKVFKLCFGLDEDKFEEQWKKYLCNNLLSFTERKKVRSFEKRKNSF